ncbi:2'-5' RNA ligase family protein [[Limnothrix rosea] IAM M-220]|uniref:2'-5' RNA ligase family protein n=1 Tax=[Limnothrix rosea] IAM M-220 TaxID=454133 RepID=UPI00095BB306|nr:2'-5' RNA ligase family protein [[Limnothrix rosea] IAM M-220]OKH18514.1 hypothetical protein NIES208_05825 [[Limnothrix rosea] IAM M-220]
MGKSLYFVALLLPPDIAAIATQWKQYCADHFDTKKAFNSPPHITLQPPFKVHDRDRDLLMGVLTKFATDSPNIPVKLDGFNCFKPRVIYIDVLKTNELLMIQERLKREFIERLEIRDERYGDRPFCPHATIAFKDLSKANFYRAWQEFQNKPLHHEFVVPELTLLKHNGRVWEVDTTFLFENS